MGKGVGFLKLFLRNFCKKGLLRKAIKNNSDTTLFAEASINQLKLIMKYNKIKIKSIQSRHKVSCEQSRGLIIIDKDWREQSPILTLGNFLLNIWQSPKVLKSKLKSQKINRFYKE